MNRSRRVRYFSVLAVLLLSSLAGATERLPKKPFIGYIESYDDDNPGGKDDSHRDPRNSMFAHVQPGINMIALGFLFPDYKDKGKGPVNGLPYSKQFLKRAVAWFHKTHPGVPVILSMGGGGGPELVEAWKNFDPKSIAKLVRDTGIDGIEIDWELEGEKCQKQSTSSESGIVCNTDDRFTYLIHSMREAMPRPALLSIAAYGRAAFTEDLSGEAAGMAVNPLKRVGKDLDFVDIMGYGGNMGAYDPQEAFLAFRRVFPGPITMGVEVPQNNDRPFVNLQQMSDLAAFINRQPDAGMMLWNLQNEGWTVGPHSPEHPSADMIIQAVCEKLHTEGCPQKTQVTTRAEPCPPEEPAQQPFSQFDWFQEALRKIPQD